MEEILAGLFSSGNILLVLVGACLLIAQWYFSSKKDNANTATRLDAIERRLQENFDADEKNAENDAALARRVEHVEELILEMYVPVTGKMPE